MRSMATVQLGRETNDFYSPPSTMPMMVIDPMVISAILQLWFCLTCTSATRKCFIFFYGSRGATTTIAIPIFKYIKGGLD
ncbi:unnamed protein product [Amoebophrya sp. A25]|nr:unnamed protein product [Amoebophrya sp. A25]